MPSPRIINFAGLLICIGALVFAVMYLEGVLRLEACPLCVVDRVLLIGMAAIFLVAALHNPRRFGRRVYGVLNLFIASLGISVASRHIWLQNLPADQVPECGVDLAYMLESFPIAETLRMVLTGSGECAEIQWRFLGLTIPEQTLLVFVALVVLVLYQILRHTDTPSRG